MTRDDIIRMALEIGYPLACYETGPYVPPLLETLLNRAAAFEREAAMKDAERYRHAMREAMYLLDQPEPRPHAAFSELLLALNPAIDNRKKSAIRARGEK